MKDFTMVTMLELQRAVKKILVRDEFCPD